MTRTFAAILVASVAAPAVGAAQTGAPSPLMSASGGVLAEEFVSKRAPGDFHTEELRLKRAVATAETGLARRAAAHALASFYLRHELNIEAIAALAPGDLSADELSERYVVALASYRLGRFKDAADILGGGDATLEGSALALEGMALARLGAYERAARALTAASAPPDAQLRAEFHLARAAAALAAGRVNAAVAALESLGPVKPEGRERREAAFLAAGVAAVRGDHGAAREGWKRLADGQDAVGARSSLSLLKDDLRLEAVSREGALERSRALSLRARGGEAEREALLLVGELAAGTMEGLTALRLLAERHPQADVARQARQRLGTELTQMAAADGGLTAAANARLFYEMVDYAPPGAEGDRLIRAVAERLVALDLNSEAAELLEHQVFQRLRGAERSLVAADLAAMYLVDRRPAEALRVIASTRIQGLDPAAGRRRLLLEAEALERIGEGERALALLDGVEGADAEAIRGAAHWDRQEWADAADAYRSSLRGEKPPLTPTAENAAVRAFAAYLLAGDKTAFEGFRREMAAALSPDVGRLIASLADEARTVEVLDAYRRYYQLPDEMG